jgi:hypothetical protein
VYIGFLNEHVCIYIYTKFYLLGRSFLVACSTFDFCISILPYF